MNSCQLDCEILTYSEIHVNVTFLRVVADNIICNKILSINRNAT